MKTPIKKVNSLEYLRGNKEIKKLSIKETFRREEEE